LHGKPVVWWTSLYDSKARTVAWPKGLKGVLLAQLLKRVDGVATYSDSAASVLRARLPSLRNVVVAPNVLDTDELMRAEAEWTCDRSRLDHFARENGLLARRVVLFVGRLVPAKRLDDLLLTFEIVRRKRPDLDLLLAIVGNGPERQRLDEMAEQLEISEDVKFFGEIRDPRDVCPIFLNARVFLLPGAGGLAIYQALAHGVPVVATRADGTEQDLVREGESGFLCEPNDLEMLARRTQSVLEAERDDWLRLSTMCRKVAREDLHVRVMVQEIRRVLETAHFIGLNARELRARPLTEG
jgi:glycosyltransferase involved in cell wall biosynthesis